MVNRWRENLGSQLDLRTLAVARAKRKCGSAYTPFRIQLESFCISSVDGKSPAHALTAYQVFIIATLAHTPTSGKLPNNPLSLPQQLARNVDRTRSCVSPASNTLHILFGPGGFEESRPHARRAF
jgi:hypothetical protein